jgi:surface antigen
MNVSTTLRHLLIAATIALPCVVLADPPSQAPAHGWRVKHDPTYAGYSGRNWQRDYGVRLGRCDRAEIGAVLGGMVGAAVGVEAGAGAGDGQLVAVVVGSVIGAAVGAEIGRRMDRTDRSCVGHALELANYGQTVAWSNPATKVSYQLTPLADGRVSTDGCRRFRLVAHGSFGLSEGRTTACPDGDAVWQLAPDVRLSRR